VVYELSRHMSKLMEDARMKTNDLDEVRQQQWQEPELIQLTRNEPEKAVAKGCCSANMSLLDSGCNRPMRG
jgi:hypothetical protein